MSEYDFEPYGDPDMSFIYPQQPPAPMPRNFTTPWQMQHSGSRSMSELSQNETVPSSNINSEHFCLPDSLASDNTFSAFAAEARHIWGSASQTRELLSNFSSICSSASTMTSSTACTYPTLSAASFGLAPSFDFTRHVMQLNPLSCNPVCTHCDLAISMDPSQVRSLYVGSGYALDAAGQSQELSAMETEDLEEYSLGSGFPG